MNRILIAVDGSEPSLKAARMGADIAVRFGAKLTLVHVVPKLLLPPDVYGLTIATSVLYGSPAEAIAEEGAASDVGMIVVGSRGHGAVARMFLGSVSDRLVHIDRKSTRLNSSHVKISYAVFCL